MPRPRALAVVTLAVVAGAAGVVLLVVDDDPAGLQTVRDATGDLTVEVPEGWSQFETRPLESGARSLPYVQAAPDLDAYRARVDAPGLEALLVPGLGRDDVRRVLEETAERLRPVEPCAGAHERRVASNGWEGLEVVHSGCGEADADIHLLVVAAPSDDQVLVLGTQALGGEERDRIVDALTARAGRDASPRRGWNPDRNQTAPGAPAAGSAACGGDRGRCAFDDKGETTGVSHR